MRKISWGINKLGFLEDEALGNGPNLGDDNSNALQLGTKLAAVGFGLSADEDGDNSFEAIFSSDPAEERVSEAEEDNA